MAQSNRRKDVGEVGQKLRSFPARNIAAQLFKLFVMSPAFLHCAGEQIGHAAKSSEANTGMNPDYAASSFNAAAEVAAREEAERSWGGEGRILCEHGHELIGMLRMGRAQAPLLPREVEASKASHNTADSTFRDILKKRVLQQFRTPVAAGEGTNAATQTPASHTVSDYLSPLNSIEHNAALNNVHFTDSFLSELPCRDQVLLLVAMLQNTRAALSTTDGHPPDRQSALQQLVTTTADSLSILPPYTSRPPLAVTDVTPPPPATVQDATGEETEGQSRPVGPAAARSTAAMPYSAPIVSSPTPLTALFLPDSSQVPEHLSARVPPLLTEVSNLSSSLSAAPVTALNPGRTVGPSPLTPSLALGPTLSQASSLAETISTSVPTVPFSSSTSHPLQLMQVPLDGSPPADTSPGVQQTFVRPAAPTAIGTSNFVGNGRVFDYSGRTVAPVYVSPHVRRSTAPIVYIPSALLASPFISGPLSPTIVGARVSNAVGTAVGQTTQLVDDTLRSAIVNVVNPATQGATSLLHGVQAVNQKLQVGSEVATKALLDFAAYRRNHPQDSLAEFINTLEEVTDTLNQAATTTPDPRLQSKTATQTQLEDRTYVAGGELLEGMGHASNSSSETEKSNPPPQEQGTRSFQQKKHSTPARLGALKEMQPESLPPNSGTSGSAMTSTEPPLSSALTGKTTQRVNLREVLTTEQLQVMEMLTGVLNMGFDAALGFVKRQKYGIAGLKQFPFFQPLQQRVIQAAYRASDRAAAERAALDGKSASRAEPTVLEQNFPRHHRTQASHVQPDRVKNTSNTLPPMKKDALLWVTPFADGIKLRPEAQGVQRQASTNTILQIPTATSGQPLPNLTTDITGQLDWASHPVQKQREQGQVWQAITPAASTLGVGRQVSADRQFATRPQLEPVTLYGTQSVSTPYGPSTARVLSTGMLLHTPAEDQRRRTEPVSPTQVESAPHGADASPSWQHQRRLRQRPHSNKTTTITFHSASAPARRLHHGRNKPGFVQRRLKESVTTTDSLAPTAVPSAPVDAITPQPASVEKLSASLAVPSRRRVVSNEAYESVDDITGAQPGLRYLRENQQHRDSVKDEDTADGTFMSDAPSSGMAFLDQHLQQDASRPFQPQLPRHFRNLTHLIERTAPETPGEALELPTEKPSGRGRQGEQWHVVLDTSEDLKGARTTHVESAQLQGSATAAVKEEPCLIQTSAISKALLGEVTTQLLPPQKAQSKQRITFSGLDRLALSDLPSLTDTSSLSRQQPSATGENISQARRLAERSLLASSAAAANVAAAAAASRLPAAAVGVPVFPTAVEQILSRIGLQEKCVLSNVRYKGLATVVDRRSSLGSCQAACRADVAGAAVSARTHFPAPKTPQATRRAPGESIVGEALRLDAAPCRYSSYFTEVGLCYRYATVEGLIAAAGYVSAPITCSIIEQQLPQMRAPWLQSYASFSPLNAALASASQNLTPTTGGQQMQLSLAPQAVPAHAEQQQWNTDMHHSLSQDHTAHQNGGIRHAALARTPSQSISYGEGKPYRAIEQHHGKAVAQPNSAASNSLPLTPITTPVQTSADFEVPNTFIKEAEAYNSSTHVWDPLEQQADAHMPTSQTIQNPGAPQFEYIPFPADPPVMQEGSGTNVFSNRPGEAYNAPKLLLNGDIAGLQLTGQQVVFPPPSAAVPTSGGFVSAGIHPGTGGPHSSVSVANVPGILPLASTPIGASVVGHAAPPVTISTTAIGAGVPLVPLPPAPPPMTALSALPPLPSITTPIAGTASSILQTAQGLMQTGNALMQAFPLQQLLDAGQQLYASGFFRNRGMKHLQLPFLGQQKQELPPPPGMEKPTVTCATEGMTCCVPENAAEKWKERPPYLNNHEWDRKCRAHFVSITNSLCATTSYVLKGKGRQPGSSEVQSAADAKLFPAPEDEVDQCGLVLTETREFWVFRHTMVIPGRSMNNAICECKEPKTPNQEGLRQIEGFATWEFSLQAVHDMEAQVERGEKIAKGLGTALALTTVLGRQGEEALGHMLEHTNTVTA